MEEEAPMGLRAVISYATKTSLRVHFESVNWLLNKILPRGDAYFSGDEEEQNWW
jgi:hypothetical protein